MVHWRALPWGLKMEMVLVSLLDETSLQQPSDVCFVSESDEMRALMLARLKGGGLASYCDVWTDGYFRYGMERSKDSRLA